MNTQELVLANLCQLFQKTDDPAELCLCLLETTARLFGGVIKHGHVEYVEPMVVDLIHHNLAFGNRVMNEVEE